MLCHSDNGGQVFFLFLPFHQGFAYLCLCNTVEVFADGFFHGLWGYIQITLTMRSRIRIWKMSLEEAVTKEVGPMNAA